MKSTHQRNVAAMQAAPRCQAITKAGVSCRNPALRGGPLCKRHSYEPVRPVPRAEHLAHQRSAYLEQQQEISAHAREIEKLIRKVKANDMPDWLVDELRGWRRSQLELADRDAGRLIIAARKKTVPLAPAHALASNVGTPGRTTPASVTTHAEEMLERSRERAVGAMLGLAVGDAIGVTTAGSDRGTFRQRSGMYGAGLLGLKPGEWSWDTAKMLALGDNLLEHRAFEPRSYLEELVDHRDTGSYSPSRVNIDPGNMTALALNRFRQFDELVAVEQKGIRPQNGCLARIAPVAVCYWRQPATMLEVAVQQARTTHSGTGVEDLSQSFVELVARAIEGRGKSDLLTNCDRQEPWGRTVTYGELQQMSDSRIDSGHDARTAFQAALWCVGTSDGFQDAVLKARELGGDATSIGAMAGQLAGALYGVKSIPSQWLELLAARKRIETTALELFEASLA